MRVSRMLILVVAVQYPQDLMAQFMNSQPQQPNPRLRRQLRNQAVRHAGGTSYARAFVEGRGDVAARAILACSRGQARKLVEFHDSGLLDQLPRSSEVLFAIGNPNHGDEVCRFIIENAPVLCDLEACTAFLMSPLEYSLALKSLDTGAAEVHAGRLKGPEYEWRGRMVVLGLIVAVGAVLAWRRRMTQMA
jgi:hypothetical protein